MLNLAKNLELCEDLISELSKLSEKDISSLADICLSDSFSRLRKEKNIIRLAVILECAKRVKKKYDALGISEKVYFDTMSDIKIWAEKCSKEKSFNYGWLQNHCKAELFRIGRLQFQLYECKNKTLFYNKLPFDYGEKLIYVHIPEGEKLLFNKCTESLLAANEFFQAYFPEYDYRYYFCESWLLFDGNKEFMKENSNILSFASLFNHAYSVKIDAQAIERIFGKRRLFVNAYPEKTSLQRAAKVYMKSGKKMGIGVGTIDKNSI